MSRLRVFLWPRGLLLVVLLLGGSPVPAYGLSGQVVLSFAQPYQAPDGATCTHRGADVVIADSFVRAPVSGTVRFTGRVPGPHGGSVLAATVDAAEGTVTMLPFVSLDVASGDRLSAGDLIGRVAETGDPSSPQAHLHIGLKRGGVYVDPAVLLETASPPSQVEPHGDAEPVEPPSPDVREPALGPSSAAAAAAGDAVPADGGAQIAAAGAVAAHGVEQPPAVSEKVAPEGLPAGVTVPGRTAVGHGMPVSAMGAPARVLPSSAAAASGLPRASRIALGPAAIAFVASVLSAGCFLVPLLLTRRAIAKRVVQPPVSDRLGTMLQHLRAGDTLRGLTSCSGPTAFTVPGPPAQRR